MFRETWITWRNPITVFNPRRSRIVRFCCVRDSNDTSAIPTIQTHPLPALSAIFLCNCANIARGAMSRIFVKNLPEYVVEDRLRELFSQKGEITDVKLIRAKDGKSRRFACIGFRTDHEAQEAIQYFDRSYIDTHRITCEVALKRGDANLPLPWGRYSRKKDSHSANKHARAIQHTKKDANKHARAKGQGDNSNDIVDIDDPQFQDFLQVIQPRAKSKLWANDALIVSSVGNNQEISNKKSKCTSVALHPILDQSGSLVDGFPNNPEPNKSRGLEHDGVISDMDYFKSRVTKEWSDENCANNPSERTPRNGSQVLDLEAQEDTSAKDKAQVNAREQRGQLTNLDNEKGVFDSCRLFVHNLPYTTTEEELEEHFSQFGSVSQVHLVVDKVTKRSKGIAYILFSVPEFAARATKELNESIFQGRFLYVQPAIQSPSNNEEHDVTKDQGSKTFKQRRVEERKAAEASGDTRAWNSLFIHPDTVVENIARKLGVSKSDFLDPEADDLPGRIAVAETQMILETKKALKNAGVNVESLEEFANGKVDGLKTSNHVLLVKNLPYGSSKNELAKKFEEFGSLDKIILPPPKTLALVVFLEPAEAKTAFTKLAYKCYKGAPLYLEWAPFNILGQNSTSKYDEINRGVLENDVKRAILEQNVERISDVDMMDPDRIEARSLYVKNLNFKTTDESLRKHYSEHVKEGRVLSAKVMKHLKNGKNVSSGFGFVEFDSLETAKNVCKDLKGTVLDSHVHILQPCRVEKYGKEQKTVEKNKCTKLLVKNVAFEATKKDLRQLFSPFGQIKSIRLPVKFGGDHRGFAFVEFVTQQEAQNALSALSSNHLYGRRLCVERAKEDESIDERRAQLSKKRKHISIMDKGKMKFERIDD